MTVAQLEKVSIIPQAEAPAMMPIPQVPPTQSLIHVLARAMSDPSIDVESRGGWRAICGVHRLGC